MTRPDPFPNIGRHVSLQPTTSVGARLREAREQRGVSLRQIAERTRISVMALEALERNDIKRLPGGIFTRAFIRAYAGEVGLDPERTVQDFLGQFPHESGVAGGPGRPIEDNEAIESDRRMAETVVRLVLLSLPIAGLVIYFGIRQSAAPASRTSAQPEAAQQLTFQVKPAESADEPTAVAGQPAPSAAAVSEPTTPTDAATAASGELTLVIAPRSDCWVSVAVDGAKPLSQLLAGGQRREIKAQKAMVVTVGDAGACSYTLNGVTGRPFGASGAVVTRRIDLENYRTFLVP